MESPGEDATVRDILEPTAVLLEPPLFGRYRTVRELGRGGMGVVVLAHDTILDVPVALKLIPETVVRDTDGIVDLKKEVLRGMELTHPNIVRVFSFEQDAKTAGIVMERVEGETLAQKKAQQPNRCFECDEVLPWLEQLCAALDYAHTEARIAHRDLKPGNLMLTPAGRLKVADFGIASSLSDTMSRVSVRADTSGTPPYMSPQQAMGERPTHLDDIYSLGATIYELLTGKPPFFRGNILAQVLHEEPVSITQRRAELGVTDGKPIPSAWEKMIAACLSKSPEARPRSGADVLMLLAHPERALVAGPIVPLGDLRLEKGAVEEDPVQRIHPRPVQKK
ncbi:MAG TPA: serine/threonine-protein kinase, partial [Chthoniobacteraceae bacterium]